MQRIGAAAAMLHDPVKRSEYDRLVQRDYRPAAPPGTPGAARMRCNWDADDVEYRIRLTLAEAQSGTRYTTHFHSHGILFYSIDASLFE